MLRFALWAFLPLLFCCAIDGDREKGTKIPPNIIYILADDLGYGDLGCYGQKKVRTPHIDRLAAEGMRFTRHYSGSTVCAPSRCVLMTGLHTGHCLIRGNGKNNLRPEDVTVAEVLKEAGYATGLIGKWGIGHEGSTGIPTKQGFDYFFGYLDQHHAHNFYPTFLIRNGKRVPLKGNVVPKEGKYGQGVATERAHYSHDLFVKEAHAFVEKNRKGPFFLYLALTIPHANNEAGKKGMEVPDLGPYADREWPEPEKGFAGMVHRMDRDIGALMARLKELGIDGNTVVMFTSDNGPHREGGHDARFFQSSGELRGIKRALYEGGIRVPMIVRWPGVVRAGSTSDHLSSFADLMATAADLAGTEPKAKHDGISFVPALRGGEGKQHEYLYYEFKSKRAIIGKRWKAVRQSVTQKTELYDLAADISEEKDVSADYPDIVKRMERAMKDSHVPLKP